MGSYCNSLYGTFDTPIVLRELRRQIEEETGLTRDQYHVLCNGRLARESDTYENGCITLVPKLLGCRSKFYLHQKQVMLEDIEKKLKKKSHLNTVPVFWSPKEMLNEIQRIRVEQHKKQVGKKAVQYKEQLEEIYSNQYNPIENTVKPTSFELENQLKEEQEKQLDKSNKRKAMSDLSIYSNKFDDYLTEKHELLLNKRAKMEQETTDANTSDDDEKVGENVEKLENEHPEFKMQFYVEIDS